MKNCIKKSEEMKIQGTAEEKILEAKEGLLKSLKDFSENRDNDFKNIYSKKTSLERNKTLMENQAASEMMEEALNRWKQRQNKFIGASKEERFKMWFEEMDREELFKWKKRINRLIEVLGIENIEQARTLGETVSKCEEEDIKLNGKLWGWKQTFEKLKADREEERTGIPVVFLGDVEASVQNQLREWNTKGLDREEIEEDVEMGRAGKSYIERIIMGLEKEEKGKKDNPTL